MFLESALIHTFFRNGLPCIFFMYKRNAGCSYVVSITHVLPIFFDSTSPFVHRFFMYPGDKFHKTTASSTPILDVIKYATLKSLSYAM